MVFLRGDHRLNEIKLPERARRALPPGARGGAARVRPASSVRALTSRSVLDARGRRGAVDRRRQPARPAPRRRDDRRRAPATCGTVEEGDTVDGNPIRIEPAIEIGNIFKLGTRYSEPLGATYLDENGTEQLIVMGSYGIGPARVWPPRRSSSTATSAGSPGRGRSRRGTSSSSRSARRARPSARPPTRSTRSSRPRTCKVLYDDREAGGGSKFADAELIGCPLRLTVGKRSLESGPRRGPGAPRPARHRGRRPAHRRRGGRAGAVGRAPLTFRRLSGLDRSGPPPPETQAGAPLRPWTIPNAIGFLRAGADRRVPGAGAVQRRRHRRAAGGAVRARRLGRLRRRDRGARHRASTAGSAR